MKSISYHYKIDFSALSLAIHKFQEVFTPT